MTLPGGGITPGELAEPDFGFPGQAPESRNVLRKRVSYGLGTTEALLGLPKLGQAAAAATLTAAFNL